VKAALLVEPGRIEVDEVPEPEPGPDDVRIAVGGVGLCGSDMAVFSGAWPAPSYPWILGHEAFGVIEAVGADVPKDRIGQTVVVEPNIACFACKQCRRGWTSACESRQSVGMNRQGALAERLVVPSRFAWPARGAEADLVCIEPATVAEAALRRLGGELPNAALVVGAGAQGLLMTLALVARGVAVRAQDVNADRVAFAVSLGAEPPETDGSETRFGLVVDTVGSPASMGVAVGRLEVGGTLLLIGLHSRPLEVTAQDLVRRQATVRGSLTYDHPRDFETAVTAVSEGRASPGRVITDTHSLDDAQLAFERSGTAPGKTWIRIGSTVTES
jgi:alcohol dehydrogenase/L-iditol 2-dehydrogenase